MNSIGIIGSGNVATQLAQDLKEVGCTINWIYSRNQETGKSLAVLIDSTFESHIPSSKVDLVLVCVKDDSVQAVLNELDSSFAVAYTTGTKPLDTLVFEGQDLGVFYPLQTFSKDRKVAISNVPFLIEANNSTFAQSLFDLAWKLSSKVQFANSEQRKKIHLSAVMVNNFTNHLIYLAQNYLQEQGLDETVLEPLIQETVAKLNDLTPFDAQTGPARRHDEVTINEHLKMLSNHPDLANVYQLLSTSILKTYHK